MEDLRNEILNSVKELNRTNNIVIFGPLAEDTHISVECVYNKLNALLGININKQVPKQEKLIKLVSKMTLYQHYQK